MISSSSSSNGAPASPSSQQPPLHFARSHTNCFSTTSSLTSILSITIIFQRYCKEDKRENEMNGDILPLPVNFLAWLFPPECIDKMLKIFFYKIIYYTK